MPQLAAGPGAPPWQSRAQRAHAVATLRWSAEEVAVIEHGERLRALGFVATAADRVARGCAFPQWPMQSDYLAAVELDLSRWYMAYMGVSWDGTAGAVVQARRKASRQCNTAANLRRKGHALELHAFCCSHLLVEPLETAWNREGAVAFEAEVGWPTRLDVGHLEWDNPNALCCCFCDALLLADEAHKCPAAAGLVYGESCCAATRVSRQVWTC